MAAFVEADLLAIGKHCANSECRQLDFLPFPCSGCGKVYCLEHRVCPECSEAGKESVVVCPLCARAVIAQPGEDVELAFDRHTRTDCDPSNYAKVHKKPRCPAASCKEKLTTINSYTCKDCSATVCLKHRLPSDHQCPGRAAATAAAAQGRVGIGSSLRRMFSGGSSSGAAAAAAGPARPQKQQVQQPTRAQQQQQPRQQPAPAAAGTGQPARAGVGQRAASAAGRAANTVQSQLQQYRQRQQQRAGGGSSAAADVIDLTGGSGPAPVAAGPEVCTQCGARFADVAALIAHAEAAHSGGWASGQIAQQQRGPAGGGGGGGPERCPHCSRGFSDAVQLVAHVEQQHGGSSANCVLC